MKHDELDDVSDIDAGWDDVPDSGAPPSPATAARRGAILSKPVSVAPASLDTDELDEAWDDDDELEGDLDDRQEPESEPGSAGSGAKPGASAVGATDFDAAAKRLDAGWGLDDEPDAGEAETAPAVARVSPSLLQSAVPPALAAKTATHKATSAASRTPAVRPLAEVPTAPKTTQAEAGARPSSNQVRKSLQQRVSFKKAHRALALKNEEHSRRRKRSSKAERKALRREQAKRARAARELEAQAELERQAQAERERKAAAGQQRKPSEKTSRNKQQNKAGNAHKRMPGASKSVARSSKREVAKQREGAKLASESLASAARAKKKRNRGRDERRRRQKRQRVLILLGVLMALVLAASAWFAAGR